MAEDNQSPSAGEAGARAEGPGAEEPEQAAPQAEEPAAGEGVPPRRRGALWLALTALLVALGAAGAGGYAYWRLDQRLQGMDGRLAEALEERRGVRRALEGLRGRLGDLGQRQEELAGRAEGLGQRVEALEKATSDLVDRLKGGASYWQLERVESLLHAADRVARLERDPEAAYAALAEADDMLRELKDPAWLEVRQVVQDAMTRLEQVSAPDIPGIAFKLASLSDTVMDLPLKGQQRLAEASPPPADARPEDHPEGIWGRIKEGVGAFWADLRGLVRLRRTGKEIEPLLPPDKSGFLRHNLVLNLQAARLAALKGQPQPYERALGEAGDWVERFFDGDNDRVASVLATLKDLRQRPVQVDLPDLGEPIRAFRRVRQEQDS